MNELKIIIPFWYKPFIRYMPKFWEKLPKEKLGKYKAGYDIAVISFSTPIKMGKRKSGFKSLQQAYLYARWTALRADFRSLGSNTGIIWVINKN